jgi:NAD-dependent deacetylase
MTPLTLSPELCGRLREARRAVAFTGAGVSQESGLATFRGGGESLWQRFRPEELATPEAFARHPRQVWQWYAWRHAAAGAAEPNPGHHALVRFADLFPSFLLVTQNVDGLHRRAGSRDVVELHGTLREARCHACGRRMEMREALERSPDEPPACACGGRFRPAVVWFGEALPAAALERAMAAASRADVLIAAGTSATVFPAAGLIELAHRGGAVVIEVNPQPTAFSGLADLRVTAPAGQALPALEEEVRRCRRAPS